MSDRKYQSLIEEALSRHPLVPGVSIAVIQNYVVTPYCAGLARVQTNHAFTSEHFMQCASLSKTVATAFAIEYFTNKSIDMLSTSVNSLLAQYSLPWRIEVSPTSGLPRDNADKVTLSMLVNHTALGMHYVYGIPLKDYVPKPIELLTGAPAAAKYGYSALLLERQPGQSFSYSGGTTSL